MVKDWDKLRRIYDKTGGYCHLCGKKLAFTNHGAIGSKGCWEVDHSLPRARGGTDHFNNLYPACSSCNREKSTQPTGKIRRINGISRPTLGILDQDSSNPWTILAIAAGVSILGLLSFSAASKSSGGKVGEKW